MKIILFFILITMTTLAQAWNRSYFDVNSGGSYQIDATKKLNPLSSNIISLRWKVNSKNAFSLPTAELYGRGYPANCRIKDTILLTSDYLPQTKTWVHSWEIKVQFSLEQKRPAMCFVTLFHPNEKNVHAVIHWTEKNRGQDPIPDLNPKYGNGKDNGDRNGNCAIYDCHESSRTNPGGPDDSNDDNYRDNQSDENFDGGGYNNSNI